MIKIYVKKNPCGEWQMIGTVATWEQANRVQAKACQQGVYCKAVEE